MNSNQEPDNQPVDGERELRDLMISGSPLDDSIDAGHRRELRAQMLEAFDQARSENVGVAAVTVAERGTSKLKLAIATSLAACFVGLAYFFVLTRGGAKNEEVANRVSRPMPNDTEFADARLVDSLADVAMFSEEVSANSFFVALAVCQQAHEDRVTFEAR